MRRRIPMLARVLVLALLSIGAGRADAVNYFIEVQSSPGGVVSPSGMVEVEAGGSQTFTFTPSGCLQVGVVTVDDVPVGTGISEYTFTNVQADHILYVPFGAGATATTLDIRPIQQQCALPETLIATVANADGGQVRFYQGATLLATRTLSGDTARYALPNGLPTGSHTFHASYLGTNCTGPSDSPEVAYEVTETGPATMELTLDVPHLAPPASLVGVTSTLRINGTVAGKGQVTFYDNGSVAGTGVMQNGLAGIGYNTSNPGMHIFTAVAHLTYCLGEVASEPETLIVTSSGSSTALTIAPPAADSGQSVVLTATVHPADATGVVDFIDLTHGGVAVGTGTLANGVASVPYGPLVESCTMRADYHGDGQVPPSSSEPVFLKVTPPSRIVLSVAPDSVEFGKSAQLNVTISPPGATGVVHFLDLTHGVEIGSANVFGGYSATLLYAPGSDEDRVLQASYDGDAEHQSGLSNSAPLKVALSPRCGTYQSYATGDGPRRVALGDMNGDGHLDLVTMNVASASVSVLLGNGDGTFQPRIDASVDPGSSSIAIGDLNADGRLDVVTSSTRVSVRLGQGDGTLGSASYAPGTTGGPTSLAIADLDGDGRLDVAVASEGAWQIFVFLGNGDGTFRTGPSLPTGPYPKDLAIADLNGDSWPDLVTADQFEYISSHVPTTSGGISIHMGGGGGSFGSRNAFRTTCDNPLSVAIVDVNGDGRLDVVTADHGYNGPLCSNVSLLSGHGDGTFIQGQAIGTSGSGPVHATIGDFDADGLWDIAEVNDYGNGYGTYHESRLSLLHGQGGGVFQPVAACAPGGDYTSVTIADLNRDGGPDVLVTDWVDDAVLVFLNAHPSAPASVGGDAAIVETAITLIAPNPARSKSRIEYTVARAGHVRVAVTDVAGRIVATLFDGLQQAGRFTVAWDGTSGGARLPAGLYFVRLRTPDRVVSRALARLR